MEKDMYTLNSAIDNLEEDKNKVLLMTLHNAKGLEFSNVFMVGMEEGIFPGFISMMSGEEDEIEEERRLCYVGITRARERLYLSSADRRMVRGQQQYSRPSRFVEEIADEYIDQYNNKSSHHAHSSSRSGYDYGMGDSSHRSGQRNKPEVYQLKNFKVAPLTELSYGKGDRVKHIKFGLGTVTEIVKNGKDHEVTVEFDRVGRKKMFASFAKLKKVEK